MTVWKSKECRQKLADLLLSLKTAPSANNAYKMVNELREALDNITVVDLEAVETELKKINTESSAAERKKIAHLKDQTK